MLRKREIDIKQKGLEPVYWLTNVTVLYFLATSMSFRMDFAFLTKDLSSIAFRIVWLWDDDNEDETVKWLEKNRREQGWNSRPRDRRVNPSANYESYQKYKFRMILFLCILCALVWIITKTRLYNVDPLKPHFYWVKLGFTGVYIIFLISAQNTDCGYSLEPPRRGGSNEYPQSMFWAEIWKNTRIFI